MPRENATRHFREKIPYKLAYKLREKANTQKNVINLSRMTAISAGGDGRGNHGQAYKDKSKPTDIRSSNINAAKGKSKFSAFLIHVRGTTMISQDEKILI